MIIPTPEYDPMFADDGALFRTGIIQYIHREFSDVAGSHLQRLPVKTVWKHSRESARYDPATRHDKRTRREIHNEAAGSIYPVTGSAKPRCRHAVSATHFIHWISPRRTASSSATRGQIEPRM